MEISRRGFKIIKFTIEKKETLEIMAENRKEFEVCLNEGWKIIKEEEVKEKKK